MVAQARRFMPFLEGSRQCVGMSLARMTTAATVAALLSQFTFRLADSVCPSQPALAQACWVFSGFHCNTGIKCCNACNLCLSSWTPVHACFQPIAHVLDTQGARCRALA